MFTGWLAGSSIERYLVRVPAWRKMDILTWAEYVQHSYMGNGFLLYQVEAGCAFLLLLVSCIIIALHRLKFVAWQVFSATFLMAAAIGVTFFTAPVLLNLRELGDDPVLLQEAFDKVHGAGIYRAAAQVLAFVACAWAMGRCFVIRYVRM